jgi:uncharacterized protein involved in exopolysaccharide biosynthesis
VYSSLVQSREEARIREVRDLPVLTVIEPPKLPVTGEARKTVLRTLLGLMVGGLVGGLIALVRHASSNARRATGDEAEFFSLLGELRPRLRRRAR